MISLMHKSSLLTRSRDYVTLQGTGPLLSVCHLHFGERVLVKATHFIFLYGKPKLPGQASNHTLKILKHIRGLLTTGGQKVISGG